MKLPFTWILSSWWQNNTNTIRTTLNLAEKPKKKFCNFSWNVKNLGPIKTILRRFPTKNLQIFNRHCKEYEITFYMNIVMLMAKQHKHHQNDFELDWKIEKKWCFFVKTAKTGVQLKYFCDVFRQKTHKLSIVIAKSMKLPFTWILSSWWQNNTNTIRTILNVTEKSKKNKFFLLKRQKPGSNQSTFVTFSDKKLTNFQSSLQRTWNYLSHDHCHVDGKTTQTPSERLWTWLKNRKKYCCFVKTAKVGVQSK